MSIRSARRCAFMSGLLRKCEPESASHAHLAVYSDAASMRLDCQLAEGQAETCRVHSIFVSSFDSRELIENASLILCGDAVATIRDSDLDIPKLSFEIHAHA